MAAGCWENALGPKENAIATTVREIKIPAWRLIRSNQGPKIAILCSGNVSMIPRDLANRVNTVLQQ